MSNALLNPPAEPLLPARYVRGEKLLELIFDAECRPSIRWLREQQARRAIPFVKVGNLVFFDPPAVRAHLNAKAAIKGKH